MSEKDDLQAEPAETPKSKAGAVLTSVTFNSTPEEKFKKMLKNAGGKPSSLSMQDT